MRRDRSKHCYLKTGPSQLFRTITALSGQKPTGFSVLNKRVLLLKSSNATPQSASEKNMIQI